MKYLMGISYVNRPDLLEEAVNSIPAYWNNTIVIDNSDDRSLRGATWLQGKAAVYEPPVPMTFPQRMNWVNAQAEKLGCDVVMFMHDDTVAHPGTPERFLETLERLTQENPRWGVAFTRAEGMQTDYDYFCAFRMDAVKAVGAWDERFMQYFSDTDFYWRLLAAGYEHVYTGLPVKHYGGSSTFADPYRKAVFNASFPMYDQYYREKWGGTWFDERYAKPFQPESAPFAPAKPRDWRFVL
ncbi:glycosyltransferase family 2 protein [Paenibacillus sp. TRM 82003]|nr:glycosyltransferase family 2 protein [Paenibacillus sp. TRM 82003]